MRAPRRSLAVLTAWQSAPTPQLAIRLPTCPALPAARLQEEMVRRLSAGARAGRASTAEKALEKIKADGTYVDKPFVAKKR